MIRDFHADPLPQGCPFSFISRLKKNTINNVSTEATLGALRYKLCGTDDLEARQIKDWFAFTLDEKTSGLWGYFNEGACNFKVTAGGKKETNGTTTGKDQSLIELYDGVSYHGANYYVKKEGTTPEAGYYLYSAGFKDAYTSLVKPLESSFWGFSAGKYEYKLQASNTQTLWELWSSQGFYHGTYAKSNMVGSYQSCNGDANFYGTIVKTSEASMWGFNSTNWQFKMESKGSAASLQMWNAGLVTKGFARMYAYDAAGGFSCALGDKLSSTLEPSSLWCKDIVSKTNSNLYAGGLWIGQQNNAESCFIDGSVIWVKGVSGDDGKFYPGWMGVKKANGSYCYIDGSYIWAAGFGADAKIYPGEIWAKTSGGGQFSAVGGTMTLSYGGGYVGTYEPGAITLTGGGTVYMSASALGGQTASFQPLTVCVGGVTKTAYFLMTYPQ